MNFMENHHNAETVQNNRHKAGPAAIRTKLARDRETIPCSMTARFTRNFEAALVVMHERQKNGQSPGPFAVA